MDINEVLEALELVAREKGVPTDTILDALANDQAATVGTQAARSVGVLP